MQLPQLSELGKLSICHFAYGGVGVGGGSKMESQAPIPIRVRGSSNGLTNHPGGDVYRGLLMHAGLLFVVVVVVGRGTHL